MANPLHCVLFNVRSILALNRRTMFANLVATHKPDVLFIAESWLMPCITDSELFLAGYCLYRCDRRPQVDGISSHGGSFIAVRDNMPSTQFIDFPYCDICSCCILDSGTTRILAICVYNAPAGSNYKIPSKRLSEIIAFAGAQSSKFSEIIVCGDFNMPSADWSSFTSTDSDDETLLHMIDAQHFAQQVELQTLGQNTLDLVFTRFDSIIDLEICGAFSAFPSDHCPVSFSINCPLNAPVKLHARRKPSFCAANFEALSADLLATPFPGCCSPDSDTLINVWYEWVRSAVLRHVPRRTRHRDSLPPWVSQATSHLMKQLETAKRVDSRKHRGPSAKATRLQQPAYEACASDQSVYESFLSNVRDTRRLFKYYRSVKKDYLYPSVMTHNGADGSTDVAKAEMFNLFFISVYSPTQILPHWADLPDVQSHLPPIEDFDTSEAVIRNVLATLDVTKSCGNDNLPPVLFRNAADGIAKSSSSVFSHIRQTCCYPTVWKQSVVIPVHKGKSKASVDNYRPVSLLPIVSKIFEKCIFHRLYFYVSGWLHTSQHGFRRNRSCITQLLIYLDKVYSAIDAGLEVEVMYTDFSKAFDKVDHNILLRTLYHLGVRGKLWHLIRSYLSDRYQCVRVGEECSSYLTVNSGVPQGSLLGPLLFLVLVNDFADACDKTACFLCADDSKILRLDGRPSCLQSDIYRVQQWSESNGLQLNVAKCVYMTFQGPSHEVLLDERIIPLSETHSDLGLLIAANLRWTQHVNRQCQNASRVFYMIKRNAPNLPPVVKVNLYKSMILPVLIYASVCWSPNIGDLKKMESFQKRVTRWILYDDNYCDRLTKLNLLPLSLYLQLTDLLMLSKIIAGKHDVDYSSCITFRDTGKMRQQQGLSKLISVLPINYRSSN